MGFEGEDHSFGDEFGEFVFGEAFSEVGGVEEDLGLEVDFLDFGGEEFVIIGFHQQA